MTMGMRGWTESMRTPGQPFVEEYEDVFEVWDLGHRGHSWGGLYPALHAMTALTPEKARWHNLRRPNILRRDLLKMDSVLTGYTIIDLSRDMAGSYACMLLGDMGAPVVKVETPEGQGWRGEAPFHHWNRGKKSVALDLSVEGARGALEAIVKSGDVVVEDYLPREARERGLDYETLSKLNPEVVYCAMPPFGDDGPLADKPGNDGVVSAYSALMGNQNGPGGAPEYVTVPGPSSGAAFLAAYSITSALYVREMDGVGQKVEVPLLNGSITMQGSAFIRGPGIHGDPEGDSRDPRGVQSAYRLYRCSDGKWIFIACGNDRFWGKLCIAMGMEDLMTNPRFRDAPWHFEPEDERRIKAFLDEEIGKETRDYWLQPLRRARRTCRPRRHPGRLYSRSPGVIRRHPGEY